MPIKASISIRGSVGAGGRNDPTDVRAVQQQLNDHNPPVPYTKLPVTGQCNPPTIALIQSFQSRVLGMHNPSGRIDPGSPTLVAMNAPQSSMKWATPGAAPMAAGPLRGEALLQSEAQKAGMGQIFDEIRRAVIDNGFPPLKSFIGSLEKAEDARQLLAAWKAIRGFGWAPVRAAELLAQDIRKNPAHAKKFIESVAKPGSKVATGLGKLARAGASVAIVLTVIEVADKFQQGDYLYGVSELYKIGMGKAIPWAGLVDALQSIVEGFMPASAKNTMIFKVLRACDPLGLGASGVDAICTLAIGLVEMIVKGEMDPSRLDRLLARMKSGPTAFFTELGEDLADATYEMSKWRREDWSYAVKGIPGFVKSLFQ